MREKHALLVAEREDRQRSIELEKFERRQKVRESAQETRLEG